MQKHIIQTHDVSHRESEINNFLKYLEGYKFKRATGVGRRSGNSMERNNLSKYEYINTRAVYKNTPLKKEVDKFTDSLNLTPYTLVHYILRFQPDDFLDWMDYFLWQEARAIVTKFFSIALEDEGHVEFKDLDSVKVDRYHAIEFSPQEIHAVNPVNKRQTWLVLMVPHHLVLKDVIN